MGTGTAIYLLEEVTRCFGSFKVLDIASLKLEEGGIHALVGPNGAGKTTLLKLLALLEEPSSGRILYRMKEVRPASTPLAIKREITMVSQNPVMFSTTVFSNVAYGLRFRGVRGAEKRERVEEALRVVGLEHLRRRRAGRLSSGESQRVAMARALAVRPRVLLLDEPTANVDPMNAEMIENLIRRLREEERTTVILSTHNLSQAYRLADSVITMLGGRVTDTFRENLFKARIYRERGESWARIGERAISLVTEKTGSAWVSIDPRDIIVSLQEVRSSARNCLPGRVTRIEDLGRLVLLGVEAGAVYNVQITHTSFHELGLTLGTPVYITFKSSAVNVF
jgi:tungstate transport system ATP-binding protein